MERLSKYADGVRAKADLDSVRALVTLGDEYCSGAVRALLGIAADREGEKDGHV